MKKKYNNKPFKQMKLTEKIIYVALISTILLIMFFSVYGGVHAIKHDISKDNVAYADVYNEEIASFDYASPVFRQSNNTFAYLATFRFIYNFTTKSFTMQPYYGDNFSLGDNITLTDYIGINNRYNLTLSATYSTGSTNTDTSFSLGVWLSNSIPDNVIGIEKIYSYYAQNVNGSTTYTAFEIFVDFILENGDTHPVIIYFANPVAPFTSVYSLNSPIDVRYPKLYSGDSILLDVSEIQNNAYQNGLRDGKLQANESEYQRGLQDGLDLAENATFYDLIDATFYGFGKFIYSMFSFDILGVNMYGFVITIVSVGLVAFILRLVL